MTYPAPNIPTMPPIALPPYPAQMSPTQAVGGVSQAQQQYAPQQLGMEQQYLPQYTNLDIAQQQQIMGTMLPYQAMFVQPWVSQMNAAYGSAQRQADVGDVVGLAPAAAEAYRGANPELQQYNQMLTAQAGGTPLESDLSRAMEQQALTMLQAGGALSPEAQRQAEQVARQAYADRGMQYGEPAVAAEVLSTEAMRHQRELEAQQYAMQVSGQQIQRGTAQQQFQLGVGQLQAAQAFDPFKAILGTPVNYGAMQAPMNYAYGMGQTVGNTIYDPFGSPLAAQSMGNQAAAAQAQYGAGVEAAMLQQGTNYNAAVSQELLGWTNAQQQAAMQQMGYGAPAGSGGPAPYDPTAGWYEGAWGQMIPPENSGLMRL